MLATHNAGRGGFASARIHALVEALRPAWSVGFRREVPSSLSMRFRIAAMGRSYLLRSSSRST